MRVEAALRRHVPPDDRQSARGPTANRQSGALRLANRDRRSEDLALGDRARHGSAASASSRVGVAHAIPSKRSTSTKRRVDCRRLRMMRAPVTKSGCRVRLNRHRRFGSCGSSPTVLHCFAPRSSAVPGVSSRSSRLHPLERRDERGVLGNVGEPTVPPWPARRRSRKRRWPKPPSPVWFDAGFVASRGSRTRRHVTKADSPRRMSRPAASSGPAPLTRCRERRPCVPGRPEGRLEEPTRRSVDAGRGATSARWLTP